MRRVTYQYDCGNGTNVMEYEPYNNYIPEAPKPEDEVLVEGHSYGHTSMATFRVEPAPNLLHHTILPSDHHKYASFVINDRACRQRYAGCDLIRFIACIMVQRTQMH